MSAKRWGVASYGLIAAGALAAVTKVALQNDWKSEAITGWVQGLGALIGIGIAVWVPMRQAKITHLAAQREKAESLRAVRALAWISVRAASSWWASVLQGRNTFNRTEFERGLKALDNVPLHELPTAGAVLAVSDLRDILPQLLQITAVAHANNREGTLEDRQKRTAQFFAIERDAYKCLDQLTAIADEIENA